MLWLHAAVGGDAVAIFVLVNAEDPGVSVRGILGKITRWLNSSWRERNVNVWSSHHLLNQTHTLITMVTSADPH